MRQLGRIIFLISIFLIFFESSIFAYFPGHDFVNHQRTQSSQRYYLVIEDQFRPRFEPVLVAVLAADSASDAVQSDIDVSMEEDEKVGRECEYPTYGITACFKKRGESVSSF